MMIISLGCCYNYSYGIELENTKTVVIQSKEEYFKDGASIDLGDNLDIYRGDTTQSSYVFKKRVRIIMGVIRTVGTVLSVIMLIVIGFKYMLGSIEEKAEYKKTFGIYLAGAFLIFTGTYLPQLIYDMVQQIKV